MKEMEDKMYSHAQNMEFEEAAHLRDQIKVLQDKFILL
ncbi:MAG: UvrB/UvrC motif-containing protein [Gammaproteobacteria bacterium]|nr:UvrB/UvrC motif-containing protein [Gammaproteobacteria bacterium]